MMIVLNAIKGLFYFEFITAGTFNSYKYVSSTEAKTRVMMIVGPRTSLRAQALDILHEGSALLTLLPIQL